MKTDIVFERLVVGQKLYSLMRGEVEVKILDKKRTFPIVCEVLSGGQESWSESGKLIYEHANADLFLTNPFEKNQERVIEVLINHVWKPRVLVKKVSHFAVVWDDAETIEDSKMSVSTSRHSLWRELQPEQPTAQPKEITLDGVEYVLTPKVK